MKNNWDLELDVLDLEDLLNDESDESEETSEPTDADELEEPAGPEDADELEESAGPEEADELEEPAGSEDADELDEPAGPGEADESDEPEKAAGRKNADEAMSSDKKGEPRPQVRHSAGAVRQANIAADRGAVPAEDRRSDGSVRQEGAENQRGSKKVSEEDDEEDLALDYVSLTGSLNEAMRRSSATEGEGWISSMSQTDAPSKEQEENSRGEGPRAGVPQGLGIEYEAISGARRKRRMKTEQESEGTLSGEVRSGSNLSGEDIPEEDDPSSGLTIEDDWFRERKPGAGGRGGSRRGHRPRFRGGMHGRAQRSVSGNSTSGGDVRRMEEDEDEDLPGGIPVHLILPVVIVIVLVVAIVRLLIWNRGVAIDTTTNENSFNVEVNDSLVILSSSDLEGAADDGVTTVLCLGNEPFSADTSESGLAGQIAQLGEVEVINAAFPDSQVTCENAVYSTDSLEDMDDIFNLFYVAYAIAIDDYSSLSTVASVHEDAYMEAVEALENTDFSAVDIIAIQYDGIDYINEMAMYNEDVPDELTTYVGSLANSFELLREAYPHIRIVFMSPWYSEYDGVSSRTTDLGNGTIVDYFQWAYDTCGSEGITFLDNYYGSVNENNFEEYTSDGVHLNADGCTKIADHFVYKIIQGNYAEYNVETMAVAQ